MIRHGPCVRNELAQPLKENPHAQSWESGPSKMSSERVACTVAMRLKDMENKFNMFDRNSEECWSEFVDLYQQIFNDYNLSTEQELQHLHNILSKNAFRFYLDSVQPYATTCQKPVSMMDREYESSV